MKKIPTLFERDWNGNRSRVLNQVHPGCEWVLAGEGIATRKLDGTCCMVRDGALYKRRELRKGDAEPLLFEQADYDEETGKTVGWMPVGDSSEDKYHREAFENFKNGRVQWIEGRDIVGNAIVPDGTYELVGPKVQGNPERYPLCRLVLHADSTLVVNDVPRTFDGLRDWFAGKDIEGIVFHHPDGRMAKIKLRDFGLKRK